MRSKRIIGLDADGVIIDWHNPFVDFVSRTLGLSIKPDECHIYEWLDLFKIPQGQKILINDAFVDQYGLINLPPIYGAVDGLNRIAQSNKIVIITGRKNGLEEVTINWFQRYFPYINTGDIYFAQGQGSTYAGGNGRKNKDEIAEKLGVALYFEDNPEEFIRWRSKSVVPYCVARPWNETLVGFERVGWDRIIELSIANMVSGKNSIV